MASHQIFTPTGLDNLTSGALRDPATPGLSIEMTPRGAKVWRYRRRVSRAAATVKLRLGTYPVHSIAEARAWARELNAQVEAGTDPRVALSAAEERSAMTVQRAHDLYMEAVLEGRASRAKRRNKPRTIADKREIYEREIAPRLGRLCIHDVTEKDLVSLVTIKGKTARIRANRLGAELKVFFGWAAGLRGTEVGLESDPSRRLADLRFPESPRTRKLSLEEIGWFLQALADEERDVRRAMLLWLLTAARLAEVVRARSDELSGSDWTIPACRSKNGQAHTIRLGPWGRSLLLSNSEWAFPAPRSEGPRKYGWYKARDRVVARMSRIAGRPVERFTPHDFRRTARSNTKRLNVDFETAEAMLNHLKTGLERIYDGYEMEEEKALWFLKWENEIIRLARKAGVAERLDVPLYGARPGDSAARAAAAIIPQCSAMVRVTFAYQSARESSHASTSQSLNRGQRR